MDKYVFDAVQPVLLGPVLRGLAGLVGDLGLRAVGQEEVDQRLAVENHGQVERGPPVGGTGGVEVGAATHQVADQVHLTFLPAATASTPATGAGAAAPVSRETADAADGVVDAILAAGVEGRARADALDVDGVVDGLGVELGAGGEEVDPLLIPLHALDVQLEVWA